MKKLLIILSVIVLCGACKEKAREYHTVDGFALGTTYHIIVNTMDTTGLHRSIDDLFAEVTSSMSVFEGNSLVNRLNRNETDSVDRHIAYCIETAAGVSQLSGGEYDITLKPVIDAWGFNASGPGTYPDLDSLMQFVGYRKIRVAEGALTKDDPRTQIDLNSIAKGYTVDLLGGLMERYGAEDYLVEVGGEIVCKGLNAKGRDWTIGIDKPVEGNNIPGREWQAFVQLSGRALATSGNYRKFYTDPEGNKIVHTISGVTGMSRPENLLSATIVAENCTLADAYATMCMALGLERARAFLEEHADLAEGLLVFANDRGEYETFVSKTLESKISQ